VGEHHRAQDDAGDEHAEVVVGCDQSPKHGRPPSEKGLLFRSLFI
jgi:hypothetical protein